MLLAVPVRSCEYARLQDYYDSAYYFNHEARTIYEADAGLSHVTYGKHGGNLASMFRLHHNDPVYFRGRFELVWRDGASIYCSCMPNIVWSH